VHRNFYPYVAELQQEFEVHVDALTCPSLLLSCCVCTSCGAAQVSLLFPESDSYHFALADTEGFVHVRNLSKQLSRTAITEVVDWVRSERFEAIFYPEVPTRDRRVVRRIVPCCLRADQRLCFLANSQLCALCSSRSRLRMFETCCRRSFRGTVCAFSIFL
jgi:hypothetical protein